jgi:hypothetical protein
MSKCALIKDGVVINFVMAEITDTPPEGCILVELPDYDIGYTWDGVRFSPPKDIE